VSLEEEVLAEIKPTPAEAEEVRDVANSLMQRLREYAEERGIPAEPILVGSVAKDTFLKKPEIDIFVAFPPETSRQALERWGLELGSVLDDPARRYAEHPYTRGRFHGYDAEVVPCYKLRGPSDRMTAVDRTPFHLRYVEEKLSEAQKDEVRLLKKFMKGVGVYGAEAKVQGFSGYLCELLVLRFGTFKGVLRAARGWRPPIHLQLEVEARRDFEEPLVFVDPVDGERNVASAVSLESLATFIYAAREYTRRPRRSFFFPDRPQVKGVDALREEMRSRGTTFLAVASGAPEQPEDVLYPQLKKADQAIVAYLSDHDFRVLKSRAFLTEAEWLILLEMEVGRLPRVKKHPGPPPWLKNAHTFTQRWLDSPERLTGPYVEGDRLVVEVKRREVDAAEALRKALPGLSLGKHLDESVRSGYQVLQGEEILDSGYGEVLSAFMRRDLPWNLKR
jgi:tRNA nucleotidyltransferase (CCA-adding enzyme)